MILSLGALLFVGERNYRSTLVSYGYKQGGDAMVKEIIKELYENPCTEIKLQIEGSVINLVETKCLQSPAS
jgi:hypothetical protein